MMGKKKGVKKTMEVSVAIIKSSSSAAAAAEPQTPRKRGRPRKVMEGQQMTQEFQDLERADSKKGKTERLQGEEGEGERKGDKKKRLQEIKEEVVVGPSSSSMSIKEEDKNEDNKQQESSSPEKQQRKSRARKKGKPRKSS